MLNFFIGIAFFEAGAFFGFFVAALMQAARSGEIGLYGKEDFASLTPELAQKYEQLFHQPEAFLKLGNRLLVLPVPDEPPTEKPRAKPPAEYDR